MRPPLVMTPGTPLFCCPTLRPPSQERIRPGPATLSNAPRSSGTGASATGLEVGQEVRMHIDRRHRGDLSPVLRKTEAAPLLARREPPSGVRFPPPAPDRDALAGADGQRSRPLQRLRAQATAQHPLRPGWPRAWRSNL